MAENNGIYVPFIVDVETGFKEAMTLIDKGMDEMQSRMSKHALSLKFDVEGLEGKKSIKSILEDSTLNAKQLDGVMDQIAKRMEKLSQGGWVDKVTGEMKTELRELFAAFTAVGNKARGVGLIMDELRDAQKRANEENAKGAAEHQAYIDNLKARLKVEGDSIEALSIRLRANMEKLRITNQTLADGSANPEFQKTIDTISELEAQVYKYRASIAALTDKERERIGVLDEQAQTMSVMTQQLHDWRSILQKSEVGGPEFQEAAEHIAELTENLALANDEFMRMSTKEDSIKRISGEMASLNRRWAEMGRTDKFDATGKLTVDAEAMVKEMESLMDLSEKYGENLTQIANKRAELKKHQEDLHAVEDSMDALRTKLDAWQKELNSAKFGTKQYDEAAQHVTELSEKINELGESMKAMGLKAGSIDEINSRLQKLNKEWAALPARFDAFGKMTPEAKRIYEEFKKVTKELKEQGKEMSSILNKEEQRSAKAKDLFKQHKKENQILNSEAKTIDQLNAKIRLITQQLNATEIGTQRYSDLQDELAGLNKKLAETTGRVRELNTEGKKTNSLLGNLLRKTAYLLSIHTIANFLRNVREVTAEFEMQRVALGGIIQDTTRARQLFGEIKAAAVQSPFEIKDLVSFTKQLSAYRIETDKLFDVTMRLADVSAGLGVDMSRLVLAYGQVRAAAVLRGQELRQFTEAGIPLVDLLAKKFTKLRGEMVSTAEVFELISERAVPFSMIEEIFNDMTNAGGIFYEMQLKQSETLKGQWMKLKDVFSIMYDEMGNTAIINDLMRGLVSTLQYLIKHWQTLADVVNVSATAFVAYKAAQAGLIPFFNYSQKAIARQIQLEKKRQIEEIKLTSLVKGGTAAEQARIAAIKKLTAADYARIYSMDKMTKAQAVSLLWRKKSNAEIVKAIAKTRLLTKAEMSAVQSMSWFQVRAKILVSSLNNLGMALKTFIASFWPIAVVAGVIRAIDEFISHTAALKDAIKKVNDVYREQEQTILSLENAFNKLNDALKGTEKAEEKAKIQAEMFGDKLEIAQKIVEQLSKYGLGDDFDLSLLDQDSIDGFIQTWINQLNDANKTVKEWGSDVARTMTQVEGWFHIFGDNLATDIKQVNDAYAKMTTNKKYRQGIEEMRNYVEKLSHTSKEYYDIITKNVGEDAKLAIAQKRRNETEYQYQMRLITNYEKIRQLAASNAFVQSRNAAYFASMFDVATNFKSKLDEVEYEFDKTWDTLKDKDELTIKMAIDKVFAENEWEDWLKEAWIERLNGKYNMNIQITPTIQKFDVAQGMKGILSSEFPTLFTEEELKNMNSVPEIGKNIEERFKKAAEALKEADSVINNLGTDASQKDIDKINEAQKTIQDEMAKDEKDRNREAIAEAIAIIDATKEQNRVLDEQIKKKHENALAEYELAKAAKERFLNENLSALGQDVRHAFPELISGNKLADIFNMQSLGEQMQKLFPDSSADLLARPLVDAAELVKKGWEEAGEGIATVYTSTFDYEDESGKHNILVTPILPDGSVLSPSELEDYVNELLSGGTITDSDKLGLVIGFDVSDQDANKLHMMQEDYYDIQERLKNSSDRYMITDEELQKIKDGVDGYEIWAKHMKELADDREKMAEAGISEETIAREQAALDAKMLDIDEQISVLSEQIKESNYETLKAEYDRLNLNYENATTADEQKKAQKDIYDFVRKTNFGAAAELETRMQLLLVQKQELNTAKEAQDGFLNYFSVLEKYEKIWKSFGERYNYSLVDNGKGGRGEDPWILIFKNRMKFVKDFSDGVKDLNKYMMENNAIAKERNIMEGRGLNLGFNGKDELDVREMTGSRDEVLKWYDDTIAKIQAKIGKLGGKMWANLGVQEILAKDTKSRVLKAWQDLLADIFKERTDFELTGFKEDLQNALDKVKDEIRRSETARKFFDDILGLTGDKELATNLSVSVYGDPGDELAKRIRKSVMGAMDAEGLNKDGAMWYDIMDAVNRMDFRPIMENISSLPKGVQDAVRDAAQAVEKYNADVSKSYAKLLNSYKETEQQRVDINTKAAERISSVEQGLALELKGIQTKLSKELRKISEDDSIKDKSSAEENAKKEAKAASDAAKARAEAAKMAISREQEGELYKLTDEYRLFFNTLNVLSVESARKIAAKQKQILNAQLANQEISFEKYRREIRAIDEQLRKYENMTSPFLTYLRDGLDGIFEMMKQRAADMRELAASINSDSIGENGAFTPTAAAKEFLDKFNKVVNFGNFAKLFKKKPTLTIKQRMEAVSAKTYNQEYINAKMRGKDDAAAKMYATQKAAEAAAAEGEQAAASAEGAAAEAAAGAAWAEFWIRNIYSLIKGFDDRFTKGGEQEAPKWLNVLASLGTWTIGIAGDEAWDRLASLNSHATEWVDAIKSGDIAGSLWAVYDAIYDTFGPNQRKIQRDIVKEQKLVEDLEYEYGRLENAIKDAFGSDYIANYNQQLTVLQAKADSYRKQAELERSKGKKADEDIAKGYERSAEEVENQMDDLKHGLSEFFTDTDITSAAKDFAQAWIDAYQEFGSTTDAMKEKFNDMIENMVINSLAAQLVQGILKPIFEQIDEAARDGALTAEEIASISALVPGAMEQIDNGMNGLVNNLTAAGINLRQQAGTFTGISRDIATASEESINGLAAGINTQNFYISHIDQNVAMILSVLTGGTTTAQASVTGQAADPYKDQMLAYASLMPDMHDDLRNIYNLLNAVIRAKVETTTKVVHTNL